MVLKSIRDYRGTNEAGQAAGQIQQRVEGGQAFMAANGPSVPSAKATAPAQAM